MSKALHISPSVHPGFGNGAGLRNLGGFRNVSLFSGCCIYLGGEGE